MRIIPQTFAHNFGSVGATIYCTHEGKLYRAIAANEVNTQQVSIVIDDAGVARCLGHSPPQRIEAYTRVDRFRHARPQEEIPAENYWFVYKIEYFDSSGDLTRTEFYAGGDQNILLATYDGYLPAQTISGYRWLYKNQSLDTLHPDTQIFSLNAGYDSAFENIREEIESGVFTEEAEALISGAGESGSFSYTGNENGVYGLNGTLSLSPLKVNLYHEYLVEASFNFNAAATLSDVTSLLDFTSVAVLMEATTPPGADTSEDPSLAALRRVEISADPSNGLITTVVESANFSNGDREDLTSVSEGFSFNEKKVEILRISPEFGIGRSSTSLSSTGSYSASVSGTFKLKINPIIVYCSRSESAFYTAIRRLIDEDTWVLDYFKNGKLIATFSESDIPAPNPDDWRAFLREPDPWEVEAVSDNPCINQYKTDRTANLIAGQLRQVADLGILEPLKTAAAEIEFTQRAAVPNEELCSLGPGANLIKLAARLTDPSPLEGETAETTILWAAP